MKEELSFYKGATYIDNENGEETGGSSSGGSDIKKNLLYIGNLNDGESLKITAGVLDYDSEQALWEAEYTYEIGKGEFPSYADYAISYGSTVITIK